MSFLSLDIGSCGYEAWDCYHHFATMKEARLRMKPIWLGRESRENHRWGWCSWIKPALKLTLTLASTYLRTDFPVVWYLHGRSFF